DRPLLQRNDSMAPRFFCEILHKTKARAPTRALRESCAARARSEAGRRSIHRPTAAMSARSAATGVESARAKNKQNDARFAPRSRWAPAHSKSWDEFVSMNSRLPHLLRAGAEAG